MFTSRVALLVLGTFLCASCGAIPPYSSVNKQAVKGFYIIKIKSTSFSDSEMAETNLSTDNLVNTNISNTTSIAIELEKVLKDQLTTTFALHKREYQLNEGDDSAVNGNQFHAGVRRYFGDRALTAFFSAEGIYTFNFNHPYLDIDFEGGPGWAIGGGLNFALNESFSVEASLFRETVWPTLSYASGNTSLPSDYEHSFNGLVGYIGLGLHF